MPNVEVRGRYRAFTYDGTTPLDFTTFSNNVSVIRRPNEISFVTLRQYIPGISTPFTTFEPGSAYVVVSRDSDANFDMGPYTRVDRLPSSLNVRSPQYYLGLDKNSITIPLSVYALSINTPLSSVTGITYVNGAGASQSTVTVDAIRNGFQTSFTHFMPNSGYQLRNRVPFTFFAPLQSEMGDACATGANSGGEYGMGYRVNNNSFPGDNIYGIWDKIVFNNNIQQVTWNGQSFNTMSIAALSSCGNTKALFVLGSNLYGQLGTGSSQQYYPTWTRVAGQWSDIEMGIRHMLATNDSGHLYACGSNQYGQLGLGSGVASANTLTLVDSSRNYVQLAASFNSTMVRVSNGFLYACGSNSGGILGLGNKTNPTYTLTQEALGLSWSSVKGHKSTAGFLAISNKKLYGSGISNPANFGYISNNTMLFKQESRGWTDIITVDIGYEGTFIRRENQNNFYASGLVGGSVNNLALIDPSGTSGRYMYAFKETTVPSSASSISLHVKPGTTPGGSLTECDLLYTLNSKLYYKNPGNTFVQTDTNAFYIFAGTSYTPVFVLLDGNRFRPTPTPTPTITLTPSPVPIQPLNISQIGIFASSQRTSNNTINTNSYVNGIPGALDNALTQTFFLNGTSSGILNHAYDYEKGNEYNRVVGIGFDGQDFNNNYPRYLYYHGGPYTKMSTEFNRGRDSDYYGFDALMITPPDPTYSTSSQGIYLYAYYFRNSSTLGEYRLAISYDRGATWPLNGTFYGMNNAYYDVANGSTCRPVFAKSRQRTATSEFEVRILFNGNFNSNVGNLHNTWPRGLVCEIAYPSSTGSLETVYNQMGEYGPTYKPWGYAFNYDYFNIPTAVSIGYDSAIRNNKILIHRRINNTWITDTVLTNISDACNRSNGSFSAFDGYNKDLISIEFNPANPDIIYIAYILNSGASTPSNVTSIPRRINVITYNMQTKTLIQNQKVISSIAGDPGYARITAVGAYQIRVDMPTLFYDKIAQKLYLYCYVAMIDNQFRFYDTVFTTSTSDNTNWSALVQFTPTCQYGPGCHGRFGSNWDLKAKY